MLVVVGLLIGRGLYFVGMVFNREVLETEPGDVSIFQALTARGGGGI